MLNQLKDQLLIAKIWQDRFRLLIQASKNLPSPPIDKLAQMKEIHACEAKLWWQIQVCEQKVKLQAFSEARIMNGILWLIMQEVNGKSVDEVQKFNLTQFLQDCGIFDYLSQTRQLGLGELEKRLQQIECC